MDEPILQLLVEKGPRKGEAVECKPGAALRLGRVVRGNTFAVRDPGVSQKHLSFEFLRETSRWVVTDLDTSNGTVLNGSQIAPSVPVPISDGDAIKIGEMTYISVKISGGRPRPAAEKEEAVGHRGRRRGGAPPLPPARSEVEMPLDSAAEEVSETSVANGRGKGRGRGRPRRAAAASASARVSIKDEILDAVPVEESVPEVKGRTRRRRPATRGSSARVSKELEQEEPRVLAIFSDSADREAVENQRVGTRRPNTRANSARVSKEVGGEKEIEGSVLAPNLDVAAACEDGNLLVKGNADGEAEYDGEGEGGAKSLDEGGDDMDNMTLGEWFDRMEKFLPQVINDISEEIISILKEKAQRFDEFLATNSNAG